MAFSINTNANSMAALRSLSATQNSISAIQSQIQTGLKVGRATDDPSTFVISQGMRGDIGGLKAVQEGLGFGSATVGMALAAATQISDQLTDLQAKVTQAENEGLDIATLQSEADEMIAQITSIVATANFNGINLLDGIGADFNVPTSLAGSSISLADQDASISALGLDGLDLEAAYSHVAFDNGLNFIENDSFQIDIYDVSGGTIQETYIFELDGADATALLAVPDENGTPPTYVNVVSVDFTADSQMEMVGKVAKVMREEGFTVNFDNDGSMNISAAGQAIVVQAIDLNTSLTIPDVVITDDVGGTALTDIDNAKSVIGTIVTTLGTFSNRLDSQASFNQVLTDKLEEGLGILVDANLAEVSARLQSEQTKEQLGIQSLSIANAASQSILGLFN